MGGYAEVGATKADFKNYKRGQTGSDKLVNDEVEVV